MYYVSFTTRCYFWTNVMCDMQKWKCWNSSSFFYFLLYFIFVGWGWSPLATNSRSRDVNVRECECLHVHHFRLLIEPSLEVPPSDTRECRLPSSGLCRPGDPPLIQESVSLCNACCYSWEELGCWIGSHNVEATERSCHGVSWSAICRLQPEPYFI